MYDCILFDIDGTLTDSAEGITNSVESALLRMGHGPIPQEQRRLYVGPPLLGALQTINGMTPEQALEGVRLFRERFGRIGWMENRVYAGIPRLLATLKSRGIFLGVATAKPVLFAERVLEYFGLGSYFDVVSAAPMDESGLPKDEIIRRALPSWSKNPAMVGDRMYDMIGAHKAGVHAVGALYGYGTREELNESGADAICESVDELSRYLLGDDSYAAGRFITFEGIDGCGKSTQLAKLGDWLKICGWNVVRTREPGGCPAGEKVRDILLSVETGEITPECEALLFAASRAQHTASVIKPAVARGDIVLSDRYVDSSIAYQGYGRGMGAEKVAHINEPATGGLKPDMTLLYDIDTGSARSRLNREQDRMESEKAEFHARVREGFCELAAREPERIHTLDAARSVEQLFEQTRALAMRSIYGEWKLPDNTPAPKL